MYKYVVTFLIISRNLLCDAQTLSVTIEQGTVLGHKHATRSLYEFHGIPYATAPTGRDKFKAPLPAPTWEGTLDAVDKFFLCPQTMIPSEIREDCLVANVFVPENVSATVKPVVVILHAGAYIKGFGNEGLPYNLVERDIIAVTFNYRLGAYGFLCLNTEIAPGNAGLKDQIAALKWAKNNIQAFGGNPDDITILGSSAGSSSAELLMLSPAADNLFNKVIMESGSALNTWAFTPNGVHIARNTAIAYGATNVDTVAQLEEFYLSLSYLELATISGGLLNFTFVPCIEVDNRESDVVITELPREILKRGNYIKLPLLTGYTDAEGLVAYAFRDEIMAGMNANFADYLPINFDLYSAMDKNEAVELVKAFYFNVDVIDDNSLRNFTDYNSDRYFTYGMVDSAILHAMNSVPVYLYVFSYIPSTQSVLMPDLGANHCAHSIMILEIFPTLNQTYSNDDLIVQRRLVDMWTNFIKSGKPIPSDYPDYWELLEPERVNYMNIGFELQNSSFPIPERLQFWERIMRENPDTDDASRIHLWLGLLLVCLTSVMLFN